jgi:hypothetical protein
VIKPVPKTEPENIYKNPDNVTAEFKLRILPLNEKIEFAPIDKEEEKVTLFEFSIVIFPVDVVDTEPVNVGVLDRSNKIIFVLPCVRVPEKVLPCVL